MFAQATEMINLSEPITETLYGRARGRGRRGQLWARLTGRARRLLALTEVENSGTVRGRCADHQEGQVSLKAAIAKRLNLAP